jgi:hypothetical protein
MPRNIPEERRSQDGKCLLRGTNWVFKYNGLLFVLKGFLELPEGVSEIL